MVPRASEPRLHSPTNLDEHGLDARITIPARQHRQLGGIDLSVLLVDERKIHSRQEMDLGGIIGVRFATVDLEAVDAVLVDGLHG